MPLLPCSPSSDICQLFARLFSSLQRRGYSSVAEDDAPVTPEARPAGEGAPLLDEYGITPVVVREKERRSWLILLLLNLVALTYLFDGAVFVARALIDDVWESRTRLWRLFPLCPSSSTDGASNVLTDAQTSSPASLLSRPWPSL